MRGNCYKQLDLKMENPEDIIIMQCMRPTCRFRFHAGSEAEGIACPKCGSPVNKFVFQSPAERREQPGDVSFQRIELLLDNIRSAYNVGAILRTSDAAGVQHLHFSGISPTPDQQKVRKTSLGAENSIPWTHHWNALEAVAAAKNNGLQVVSLETLPDAVSILELEQAKLNFPILFVIGNEVSGVDPEILQLSDLTIKIPMFGTKRSINVASAFGIAVYFIRNLGLKKGKE